MERDTRNLSPLTRQALAGLLLMLLASALLLLAAWLTMPRPLVKDPVQTELLYVTLWTSPNECTIWHPETMVDQQTARAIVDHMGTCRERKTLRPAADTLTPRPRMEVHLRTEHTYWMVCLGSWKTDSPTGWAGSQDGTGFSARVLDPEGLEDYILSYVTC